MPDLDRPFRIQHQEQDMWCWAAVAASLCVFYQDDTGRKQCDLANRFLEPVRNGVDCCSNGSSADCNVTFSFPDAIDELGHFDSTLSGPLSFEDVGNQISANRPVAVRIKFADSSGHVIVLAGSEETSDGRQWVKVADPSGASGNLVTLEYKDVVDNYRPEATWDETYLTR